VLFSLISDKRDATGAVSGTTGGDADVEVNVGTFSFSFSSPFFSPPNELQGQYIPPFGGEDEEVDFIPNPANAENGGLVPISNGSGLNTSLSLSISTAPPMEIGLELAGTGTGEIVAGKPFCIPIPNPGIPSKPPYPLPLVVEVELNPHRGRPINVGVICSSTSPSLVGES